MAFDFGACNGAEYYDSDDGDWIVQGNNNLNWGVSTSKDIETPEVDVIKVLGVSEDDKTSSKSRTKIRKPWFAPSKRGQRDSSATLKTLDLSKLSDEDDTEEKRKRLWHLSSPCCYILLILIVLGAMFGLGFFVGIRVEPKNNA